MKFHVYLILFFLFIHTTELIAQTPDKSWLEDLMENLAENSSDEEAQTDLIETLQNYISNPLNLNTATSEELSIFPFLSDEQINNLSTYIHRKGQLLSVYELQYIDGFDFETIRKLLPFIKVAPEQNYKPNYKRYFTQGKSTVFLRSQFNLENAKGFLPLEDSLLALSPNSHYLGSKYRVYARYSYQYKNYLKYGFTMEKDPGEEFFTGTQKQGFDYMTAHLQIQNQGFIENLVLGDFSANFGQGLVLETGFGSSKSSFVLDVKKNSQGLRKYSSVDENQFLRGIGTTLKYKQIYFTPFFSYNAADANLNFNDSTLDENYAQASSLQITGLHATPAELDDKHAIHIMQTGSNIAVHGENYNLGLTYVYTHFDHPLNLGSRIYQLYSFDGQESQNMSMDYYYMLKSHVHFFGEEAFRVNGGFAVVNGMIAELAPQIKISLVHRYYSSNYWSLYANGFGEKSNTNNESGLYIGTEIYPAKSWKISAYADAYRFPWMSSTAYAPSSGVDYLFQVDKVITHTMNVYVRYKTESKQANLQNDIQYILTDSKKESLRLHAYYSPMKNLTLKSRAEFSFFSMNNEKESGYMLYQDISFSPSNLPFSISMRYAVFNTTYNTRIYAYESDVLYASSIPAYFYKGTRVYFNLTYSVSDKIDIWLRWAQFYYPELDVLSTGLNEIQGHSKSEVKAQIRIKF